MSKLRKKIKEICDSLYQTGFNDAKNKASYFPKPTQSYFHTDKILSTIYKEIKKNRPEKMEHSDTCFFLGFSKEFQNGYRERKYCDCGAYDFNETVQICFSRIDYIFKK